MAMATKEHKELAHYLKEVHLKLRKASMELGPVQAWQTHCENKEVLKKYAQYMEKLATTHWEKNCISESSAATSRLKWVTDFCSNYFVSRNFLQQRQKEVEIANKISISLETEENHLMPIKLIDVGSCYNPFKTCKYFDVTAIDLFPANKSVLECDFLNVSIGDETNVLNFKIQQLQHSYFDVVTFCFLLEYIPTSELRIKACENAYRILKGGGLLIITTPDSKHVGANSKIIKCWQYTLAKLGFTRIKYEKFKHMHCMAFRKALCKDTAVRWALLHQKPYMEYALNIPQDYNNAPEEKYRKSPSKEIKSTPEDFKELPFSYL